MEILLSNNKGKVNNKLIFHDKILKIQKKVLINQFRFYFTFILYIKVLFFLDLIHNF